LSLPDQDPVAMKVTKSINKPTPSFSEMLLHLLRYVLEVVPIIHNKFYFSFYIGKEDFFFKEEEVQTQKITFL
jgi:hypothetical protein